MARKSLPKSLRFEVFKRDSFTCQYCGGKAPDVLLEADHIEPVSNGGRDDLLNLITSCRDCNSGKSDRRILDTAVLDKQRDQLEKLQERREQIDLMFQWQNGLLETRDYVVRKLSDIWYELTQCSFTETGIHRLRKLAKSFTVEEIVTAMRSACDECIVFEGDKPTNDSVELAYSKVVAICRFSKLEAENPELMRLFYIRGILRNRFNYCNQGLAIGLLRRAHELNASVASMEEFAKTANHWTEWKSGMDEYISQAESPDGQPSASEPPIHP